MDKVGEGSEDSLQERLSEFVSDPEFEGMVSELYGILASPMDSRRRDDEKNLYSQKIAGHSLYQRNPNEVLAMLHRVVSNRILGEFVELLESDEFAEMLSTLGENCRQDLGVSEDFTRRFSGFLDKLADLTRALHKVGFDRQPGLLTKSPLSAPFNRIDVNDPNWATNLEIAENFGHALMNIFHVQGFISNARSVLEFAKDGKNESVQEEYAELDDYYLQPLSFVLPIFRHYRDSLLGKSSKTEVDVRGIIERFEMLLVARYGFPKEMKRFPIRVSSQRGVVLRNSDEDALVAAFWEIVKNAFRDDKVSTDELKRFLKMGEVYLTVNTGKALLNGREVVVVEIGDRGTPINAAAIVEKMKRFLVGWGARDITFGQILDWLSVRHLSIPLRGSDGREGEMSTGIGLHSARSIIQRHNGEVFPVNLENGVSFLIIIPVDGKDSYWNVSDTRVTGVQCGEISECVNKCLLSVRGGLSAFADDRGEEEDAGGVVYGVAA